MRIPSQFTEDNLYRRGRRRDLRPHRRILHLLLALALVLVLMHQASKPKIYETFFAALTSRSDINAVEFPIARPSDGVDPASVPRAASAPPNPDPAVTSTVVDGSVWRQGDFPAVFLFLQEANRYSMTTGSVVGVLPLLQQPDSFRNQVVRCRGQVVRCQRIDAEENVHGITEYWQLWLRPQDGADRPLVVITESVPAVVAAVDSTGIDRDGPGVLVAGRFLKRLAYQSAAGADLAPVIVGRVSAPPIPKPLGVRPTTTGSAGMLMTLIVGATLLGVALAAGVMWRTSVVARRTRRLRSPQRIRL